MKMVLAYVAVTLVTLAVSPVADEGSAPLISDLTVHPTIGAHGTVYTVSIRIVRPRNSNKIVPVLHQMRQHAEIINIPIHDDGLNGDAVKGDGIYTGQAVVPIYASKRTHRFEVFILDTAGRKSNVLEYRFTVLDEETM